MFDQQNMTDGFWLVQSPGESHVAESIGESVAGGGFSAKQQPAFVDVPRQ